MNMYLNGMVDAWRVCVFVCVLNNLIIENKKMRSFNTVSFSISVYLLIKKIPQVISGLNFYLNVNKQMLSL